MLHICGSSQQNKVCQVKPSRAQSDAANLCNYVYPHRVQALPVTFALPVFVGFALRPMDLSSTSTVSAVSTDGQFLIQLLPYAMGQHVTLDVQLPPPWTRRLPGSEPPLLELVQFHIQRYQQQWPIEIHSHRLGNFSFRVMFTHMLPRQCPVFASMSRAWYSAVCFRIHNMGHVDYRSPRQLLRQFEVVDTVIFHDSESEFHGQTDSDRISTLNFAPLFAPIRQ